MVCLLYISCLTYTIMVGNPLVIIFFLTTVIVNIVIDITIKLPVTVL